MSGRTTQPMPAFTNIDEYIANFPETTQVVLQQVRATIRQAVPEATETISYKMPGFRLGDHLLVSFAAWKSHIGLYPGVVGVEEFKDAVAAYEGEKGSLRFPLSQPIPYELIARIVKFHEQVTRADAQAKAKAKADAKAARESGSKG